MRFWIPAFAGMTVMQRSPCARTRRGGDGIDGDAADGGRGDGDGSPHARGQRGEGAVPEPPLHRNGCGGSGWVPACARTMGGGMGSRIREDNGGRGMGSRVREDNGRGGMGPRVREDKGGWVWRWRGTLPTGRGREKMGPRLREDNGKGISKALSTSWWVPACARTRGVGRGEPRFYRVGGAAYL